jgi:ubiquinone/menaquinone biosynthesis C-methylase UbiE
MLREQFLQSFFNLLYTRLAWAYDLVAWTVSAGQWYRWVEAVLPFIEHGPVLEVGCGRGRLLRPIARLGYSVVAVDSSQQMVRYATEHSSQLVLCGNGQFLPFKYGHFATLITTFPAPYIIQRQTQEEFARVVQVAGLWLWIDAPALEPSFGNLLPNIITRLAKGSSSVQSTIPLLAQERSGGLWSVHRRRLRVGQTSVILRLARRL